MKVTDACKLSFYEELGLKTEKSHVFLVKDRTTGKIYIKKEIQQYSKEVYEMLMKHPHPKIAGIHEIFEIEPGKLTVIEQLVNGETLDQYLYRKGTLEEGHVVELMLQICEGLQHLHSFHPPIIHRDMKLSNVMITDEGNIKIIDFNTSRVYKTEENQDTTILGTAGYAAPEQFGFTQTDARSDIYSLGVLMNYLLTGHHPQQQRPQNQFLAAVVETCLKMDPQHRFQNIYALQQTLLRSNFMQDKVIIQGPEIGEPKKKKGGLFSIIPGFRTRKVWKMIIAVFGYGVLFSILFQTNVSSTEGSSVFQAHLLNITLNIWILFLFVLYTNFLGIQERLPFYRTGKANTRLWGNVIFTILSFIGVISINIILSVIEGFFF